MLLVDVSTEKLKNKITEVFPQNIVGDSIAGLVVCQKNWINHKDLIESVPTVILVDPESNYDTEIPSWGYMIAVIEIGGCSFLNTAKLALEEMMALLRKTSTPDCDWFSCVLPYVQPIYSIRTNLITHYEVLARFIAKDLTIIQPELMLKWLTAVENVMIFTELLKKTSNISTPLTFNLSCDVFLDKTAFEKLTKTIRDIDTNKRKIVIEITETQLEQQSLKNVSLLKNLNSIHNLGVSFAIDDFGSASSNYDRLRRFSEIISFVKIDKEFFWDMASNSKSSSDLITGIEKRLLNFAHTMEGFKIIFEGIESKDQLMLIRQISVKSTTDIYAQGYYLGRPNKFELLQVKKEG